MGVRKLALRLNRPIDQVSDSPANSLSSGSSGDSSGGSHVRSARESFDKNDREENTALDETVVNGVQTKSNDLNWDQQRQQARMAKENTEKQNIKIEEQKRRLPDLPQPKSQESMLDFGFC